MFCRCIVSLFVGFRCSVAVAAVLPFGGNLTQCRLLVRGEVVGEGEDVRRHASRIYLGLVCVGGAVRRGTWTSTRMLGGSVRG